MFLILLFIFACIGGLIFTFLTYYGLLQKVVIKDTEIEEQNMVFQQYLGKPDGLVNIFSQWIQTANTNFKTARPFAFYYKDKKAERRGHVKAIVGIMVGIEEGEILEQLLQEINQEQIFGEVIMPTTKTLQVDFGYKGIPTCIVVKLLKIQEKILKVFKRQYPYADYQGHFEIFDFNLKPNKMLISIPYDEDNAVFIKSLYG